MCHSVTTTPLAVPSTRLQHILQLTQQIPLMVIKGKVSEPIFPLVSNVFDGHVVINNKFGHIISQTPLD